MQHMLLGPHHNICCNLGSLEVHEDTKVQTIITFRSISLPEKEGLLEKAK